MRRWLVTWAAFAAGCVDPTPHPDPTGARVVSIQSYFGECDGACVQTITVEPVVELTLEQWGSDTPLAVIEGELTELGRGELAEVNRTLGPLEPRYGCPDCADGGGMRVVVDRDTLRRDHIWEYGNPPDALNQVDTLFHHLQGALVDCKPTVWVAPGGDCTPYETD